MWEVTIVGGGAAGCSAAIYCGRFGLKTMLLDRGVGDGQLEQAAEIMNYPALLSIKGSELCELLRIQARQSGAVLRKAELRGAQLGGEVKYLETADGTVESRTVILATGARPRRLGLAGEEALVGRGVSYCATCDAPLYRGKTVAVVGGGNSAVSEALHLSRLCKEVHLLFRRPTLRVAEKEQAALRARENIRLHPAVRLTALLGEERLRGVRLSDGSELTLEGLFVAVGREPESGLIRTQLACDPSGGILTDDEMQTALPGVFAAGDVRRKTVRQIVTAAADGAIAACSAEKYIKRLGQAR